MTEKEIEISLELIREKIYVIRGQKVMLDRDLAELYGVSPKRLNEQVKRNPARFPEDLMFRLNEEENKALRSQIATLKRGQHRKYLPSVFTENGVAMLSSVLNSETAIMVNLQIMRTFTKLREIATIHKDIYKHLNRLEAKQAKSDQRITKIDHIIEEMLRLPITIKRKGKPVGFRKKT